MPSRPNASVIQPSDHATPDAAGTGQRVIQMHSGSRREGAALPADILFRLLCPAVLAWPAQQTACQSGRQAVRAGMARKSLHFAQPFGPNCSELRN
jgi:hypothetical protein